MTYTSRDVYEYISTQTNDPIIEWKTCRIAGVEFPIYTSDLAFYDKISPTFAGQKFHIPTPTLCPEERTRRRLSHQNMSKLYKRTCSATGSNIISNISPDKVFPVYDNTYRWSDKRDFRQYGKDFNFTKTFTENFQELWNVVPQPNLGRSFNLDQNSDYTNYAGGNKNCYLIFHADMNEECLYGVGIKKCTYTVDALHTHMSENMYQTINCRGCYNVFFSENCEECRNCSYIQNCVGCEYCFGCSNLSHKKYYINNIQKTKEEYDLYIQGNKQDPTHTPTYIPSLYGYNNEQVTGCSIYNSHNVKFSTDIQESKNIAYCDRIYNGPNEDVYDVNEYGMHISKVYECIATGINASNIMTGIFVNEEVSHIYYCLHVHNSKNCFGCIGVVGGEYCIFNKQYTKESYEIEVAKIITHMQTTGERGEFFDPSLSPFGYNETVAMEYFPVSYDVGTKYFSSGDDIHRMNNNSSLHQSGYHRSTYTADPVIPAGASIVDRTTNPDTSTMDDTSILKSIFLCEVSGRPYRIIKQELAFYHKHTLSLSRRHPDIRHEDRMKLRPGRTLHLRCCDQCGDEMLSVYPIDVASSSLDKGRNGGGICPQTTKIYCTTCYTQAVFA